MKRLIATLAVGAALSATAARSDCSATQMLVATTSMSSPAVSPSSFAAQPKVVYKFGTRYGRIEEQPDPPNNIHGLVVVNEPDIWMVNLADKSGQHAVDSGPSIEFHAPLVPGTTDSLWKLFEIGSEVAFMKAHNVSAAREQHGLAYRYGTGGTTVVLRTSDIGVPVSAEIKTSGDEYTVHYLSYECQEFDISLFAKPEGIRFDEAKQQ